MDNLYYVVEKGLHSVDLNIDVEETTGWKIITVYEIHPETVELIETYQKEIRNEENSEANIKEWLKGQFPDIEFKLIQL